MEDVLCGVLPQQFVHTTNSFCGKRYPAWSVDAIKNLVAANCDRVLADRRCRCFGVVKPVTVFDECYGSLGFDRNDWIANDAVAVEIDAELSFKRLSNGRGWSIPAVR